MYLEICTSIPLISYSLAYYLSCNCVWYCLSIYRLIQSLKYEADIHRQLRHPNIVSMLGVVFEDCNYGIILEFVTYGSWSDFINSIKDDEAGRFFSIQRRLKKHTNFFIEL